MIFHIEFLVWKDGISDIVDGISVNVSDANAAFLEAKSYMDIASKKGATAFRIFEHGKQPEALDLEQIKSARQF